MCGYGCPGVDGSGTDVFSKGKYNMVVALHGTKQVTLNHNAD